MRSVEAPATRTPRTLMESHHRPASEAIDAVPVEEFRRS